MTRFNAYEDSEQDPVSDDGELEALSNLEFDGSRSIGRAFEAWTDMLRGRLCPSIEDLEPVGVAGSRDVLIDLRFDADDPELTCIGGALIAGCGTRALTRLSQAPAGSLLALLAAHYRYAASTRRPIAFEGERAQAGARASTYRAILLPLSSDGEIVNFVHGRISWRDPAADGLCEAIRHELERSPPAAAPVGLAAAWPGASSQGISATG